MLVWQRQIKGWFVAERPRQGPRECEFGPELIALDRSFGFVQSPYVELLVVRVVLDKVVVLDIVDDHGTRNFD